MNETTENKRFIYEFGKFVLDPQERVLLADGKPVHLTDKVFDTLLFLLENNGRLLTKDEMMASIWEESFVEENNLAKNISRLRKILNADGVSRIETLPKRGYRFQSEVKQIDGATNLLVHRRLRVKISQTIENGSEPPAPTDGLNLTSFDEIHSIAVLPFQPLGAKADDDFFGLGITDALITQMNRTGQIPVRPTSAILKYDLRDQNAVSIGEELQVDAVLEGKFQRLENKLRLTVQMLHTTSGNSLWADSFNAEIEDFFAIQDSIAERVVHALTKKLTDEAKAKLKKRYTESVAAYQEYLKGRFFWNRRTVEDMKKALVCFERAIEIDPHFALAFAGVADIYNLLPFYDSFSPHDYFPKAKAAALRALELDDGLAEAHASLGLVFLYYDWNWTGAEIAFQRAIQLNPLYASAYHWYGIFYWKMGKTYESVVALQKAHELDPLSPIVKTWLGEVLSLAGSYEAAIKVLHEAINLAPDLFGTYYDLVRAYAGCSRLTEARRWCEKAAQIADESTATLSSLAILQAIVGDVSTAEKTLAKLLELRQKNYVSPFNIATVYAVLGKENETLLWLETAFDEREPNISSLKVDKNFNGLRNNPRFQTLLQKIGLTERKVELIAKPDLRKSSWKPVFALSILSAVIISAVGFYFWTREKSALPDETGAIRLTDNPNQDSHPRWTKDGRIRFFRFDTNRQTESLIMDADGTNQTVVKDFDNLDHGVWSPDGTKVIFAKRGDKTALYLADADGKHETALPFYGGNYDWSPDSRKIVHQKNMSIEDPDIFIYSLETAQSENISNNPAFDADPNFSPDGTQIVFASLRDGNAEIYLMNVDGGDVRRLTNHSAWDSHPVFSPDGTQIAFPSDRESENSDVYLMNADGGEIRRLTDWQTNEFVVPGCWSPDGTKIALTSNRDGSDDIFVTSAEVHRPRLVLADESSNLQFPSYSPDGRQIVYQSDMPDKSGELRLFDVENKQTRVLLKTENADVAPVFSPDGTRIAFQNKIESNTEICLIKTDGGGLTNLTQNAARDGTPAWSPDGKQIAFVSNRDGNYGIYQLYLMDADGGKQHRIHLSKGMSLTPAWSPDGRQIVFTNDKEDGAIGNFEIFSIELGIAESEKRLTVRRRADVQPAFSPDGKRLAFVSNADGNAEIYLMNADGTRLLRVTRNQAEDVSPQFSKDGRRIIFSSNRNGKFALYEINLAE